MLRAVTAFLLLKGCAIAKLATIPRSMPDLDGALAAPSAAAPIRVLRDDLGVPHVRAASEADAWYALGFVHAQDRLFQADLNRRAAWGELAPWFGERAVAYDRFVRAGDPKARAEATLAAADEATRAMLDAYARGFNAGAASLRALPIEHRLLGVPFEPWTAADSVAIAWLQVWALAENPAHELAALALADLDPAVLDGVLRTDPHSPPVDAWWATLRAVEVGPLTPEFAAFTGLRGGAPSRAAASNNWVIGPSRTASGMPIVANDPHLHQGVPSLWYVAEVKGGALHAAGATFPGMPGFPIGHTERVAWGLTNVMADTVDLAVLERAGERGYVLAGERKELVPVEVSVTPKGGDPEAGTVWTTELGPVITALEGTHLVALRSADREVVDHTPDVLRALALATSVEELLPLRTLPLVVSQNVVMADRSGDFAWQVIGSIPRRRAHTGRVPYPASDPAHGWDGWLADLPGERRPERGFVVTANSRPDHPLADAISTTYVPPGRFDRITELVEAVRRHAPEDEHPIQLDELDTVASRHLEGLLAGVAPATDDGRTCLALLREWDRVAGKDSAGAAVFALFHRELVRHALQDDLGPDATEVVLSITGGGRSPLDAGTLDAFLEDRAASVAYALERACAELRERLGDDPTGWRWGAVHPLQLEHPFVASAPLLLKRWNLPAVPSGGSDATVAAAGFSWTDDDLRVLGMASMRIVMPLDDLGASTMVHPGGQAGQPLSTLGRTHYHHWVAGQPLPLWFDDDDVERAAVHVLTLLP